MANLIYITLLKGYKNPLNQNDLPNAAESVSVNVNIGKFIRSWKNHVNENKVNFSDKNVRRKRLYLWKPLFQSFGWKFLLAAADLLLVRCAHIHVFYEANVIFDRTIVVWE